MDLRPEAGDTVAALLKRLKQVTYLYLRQGKAYRLVEHADHVSATSVPVGSHRKLSHIRDLKTGERHFVAESLTWKEKKALLAQLDRVNGSNGCEGYWQAEVEPEGIYIRRIATLGEPLTWHERGNPVSRELTLAR
jgi:hypothetical protein